jgi:hypothetical protein
VRPETWPAMFLELGATGPAGPVRRADGPSRMIGALIRSGAPIADVLDQFVSEGNTVDVVLEWARVATKARVEAAEPLGLEDYIAAVEKIHEALAAVEVWAASKG